MTKGRAMAITIGIVAPVLVIGVLIVFSISSTPTMQQRVGEAADLPLLMQAEDNGKGPARGELLLQREGTAVLKGFPVGTIDPSGDHCTRWDGVSTFTGEATWTVDSNYILSISTAAGDVSIGPYAPLFGELAWYRFGVPLCGDQETMWYWRADR